jgi:hypothetical protein
MAAHSYNKDARDPGRRALRLKPYQAVSGWKLLLEFFEPFPRVSWHGLSPSTSAPRDSRTLMRTILDHWVQIVDVTSVITAGHWTQDAEGVQKGSRRSFVARLSLLDPQRPDLRAKQNAPTSI